MTDTDPPQSGRRRSAQRFAVLSAPPALVLVVGGFILTRGGSTSHDFGIIAIGYGMGIGVATVFLAFGHNPLRRK